MTTTILSDEEWDDQFDALLPEFVKLLTGTPSDLLSRAKTLIDDHLTSACIEALAAAMIKAASSSPQTIDAFVQPLSQLRSDVAGVVVHVSDTEWPWARVFNIRFMELLDAQLSGSQSSGGPSRTEIGPSNSILTGALLSGSAIHHGLVQNVSTPYRLTYKGLRLDGSPKPKKEAIKIGAILQLAVAGKEMMEARIGKEFDHETVVKALKALVIEHPQGQQLLQDVIAFAESGFSTAYSASEAWTKLFPPIEGVR